MLAHLVVHHADRASDVGATTCRWCFGRYRLVSADSQGSADTTCRLHTPELHQEDRQYGVALQAQIAHFSVFRLLLHLLRNLVFRRPLVVKFPGNLVSADLHHLAASRSSLNLIGSGTGGNDSARLFLLHSCRSRGSGLDGGFTRSLSSGLPVEVGTPVRNGIVNLFLVYLQPLPPSGCRHQGVQEPLSTRGRVAEAWPRFPMELVVLALLALACEPMFLQVGVVDAKCLRQGIHRATLGIRRFGLLVGKFHFDLRLLPGGPRRSRDASDSLKVPAVLGGPPVDRPCVGHAVDGGNDVGV